MQNNGKSWRGHMMAKLAEGDRRAAARYARDLVVNSMLREMVDSLDRGELTDDTWREFDGRFFEIQTRGASVIAPDTTRGLLQSMAPEAIQ